MGGRPSVGPPDRDPLALGPGEHAAHAVAENGLRGMAVERGQEIAARLVQDRLQDAGRQQQAVLALLVETFDDVEALFHVAPHVADVDQLGWARQAHSAALAAYGL